MSKGTHKLVFVSLRALPKEWPNGLIFGTKQSAGICSCTVVFIADRKDDVIANHAHHVSQIEARGKGSSILTIDVRVTCHYSENDDDPGFTDSIYVPLVEWENMDETARDLYVWQMIDQRIGAEQERRANPPVEPTPEEIKRSLEQHSLTLQEQWFTNEAERMRLAREALEPIEESIAEG